MGEFELDVRGNAKIEFVIGGVQKCGTTALWQYLSQHPQIAFGPRKESHLFDDESLDWSTPAASRFLNAYPEPGPGMVLGDATPIYTFWRTSLRRIHDYNPHMRFIIILRHPVQRAYSHWRMEVARGMETLSFGEAIREGRKRLRQLDDDRLSQRHFSYVERGYYAEQLDRVYSLFPADQILLVRQPDLRRASHRVLDEICHFLSIEPFVSHPMEGQVFSHANQATPPLSETDASLLRSIYAPDLHRLRTEYGVQLDEAAHE